ncbi:MAG: hypothetical protein K0Q79_2936 [Flavipsychrobacter sp.]|jgi:hypothetical protein|nr:hypothetical protein [Flavipsychrobacter sp.]
MDIIKTQVVDTKYDELWSDSSALVGNMPVKPVLIIVNNYDAGGIEEIQLKKMLDACKLTPQQYNILQLSERQMVAWHQLRDQLQPDIIFLIGVLPSQLGVSALFSLNSANSFDGKTWLPTLSINELEKNQDIKKQLWINGMKPVLVDNPLLTTSRP